MRRLIVLTALSVFVFAKPKPEMYREKEDFQYSRSSSDDGTKSGFYGAQRGNMGGNYERAHNMDLLAQHQMGGLVRQVDGELGDGAKTRTGSVYTAANSRGIYGTGNYDLSNLKGRNFEEGETMGDFQSHSSLTSQNSGYRGHSYSGLENSAGYSSSGHAQNSRHNGYQTSNQAEQRQTDNLQIVDASQGFGRYEQNNQAGYNTKYHTQYGSHGQSEFDQGSANLHTFSGMGADSQTRYITTPVRVVLRPNGRVAIPITAQTHGISQNVLSEENNAINNDAELINQHVKPTNKVKHYEASYSYRKEWEKRHEIPGSVSVVVPTENPFPKNSELYEDTQLLQSSKNQMHSDNFQTAHSSRINSGQRASTKSAASSGSRILPTFDTQHSNTRSNEHSQLGFNTQQSQLGYNAQQSSATDAYTNAFTHEGQRSGMTSGLTDTVESIDTKPKSYHSSYSYHKSWERQGDPYVIKPAGGVFDEQASQKLMAASSNSAAYSTQQYGSHSRQTQRYSADCDNEGHVRVTRSYNQDQELEQQQNQWEDLGQKSQNLEDLGQQTQTSWENLGQHQQNKWESLQELGQETQNKWDNLEQLGQQTQNQWDNLQQLGQQTQSQWDNLQQLGQQTQDQWQNLEDLAQHTQRGLTQSQNKSLQDINEHTQKEDVSTNNERQPDSQHKILEDFEQQTSNQNENLQDFNQHNQKEDILTNFEQKTSNQNENLEDFNQHNQKEDILTNFEQQISNQNANLEDFNQHNQKEDLLTNFEQQTSNQNENLEDFNQHNQKEDILTNFEQQISNQNEKLNDFNKHSQKEDVLTTFEQEGTNKNGNLENFSQHSQKEILTNFEQQADNNHDKNLEDFNPHIKNEDVLKNYNQQANGEEILTEKNFNPEENLPKAFNREHISGFEPQSNKLNVHTNNFNNFYNQFEPNLQANNSLSSETGEPLQSLWDRIDNLGGEFKASESESQDKHFIAHSNFYSYIHNEHPMQNSFSWGDIPMHPIVDLPKSNIGNNYQNIGHNNLFDEQKQSTSTIKPILLAHDLSRPGENAVVSTDTQENKTFFNLNVNSADEGRGDIGPEDALFEISVTQKPYKTPEEIETLSLIKESNIQKEDDIIIQTSSMKSTDSKLTITNLNNTENTNQIREHRIFSTLNTQRTTVLPIDDNSTTLKNIVHIYRESMNKPTTDELILSNHNLYRQKIQDQEDDTQQQNLEQQFEDFDHQLQNSWLPTDNLQQGYDQQNMEQQFEVFNQHENMQDQTSLQGFRQQFQSSRQLEEGLRRQFQEKPEFRETNVNTQNLIPIHTSPADVVDSNEGSKDQHVDTQKDEDFKSHLSPVETSFENPGFWSSVGSKLSNAKNKVYSWFKRT